MLFRRVIFYFLPRGPGELLHFTAKWWLFEQLVKETHSYIVYKITSQSWESRKTFYEYVSVLADYHREEMECIYYSKNWLFFFLLRV